MPVPFESKPQICQNMIIEDGCEESTAAHTPRPNPFGLDLGAALGEGSWDDILAAPTNNESCIPFLLLQMKCIHPVAILFLLFLCSFLFPHRFRFAATVLCIISLEFALTSCQTDGQRQLVYI